MNVTINRKIIIAGSLDKTIEKIIQILIKIKRTVLISGYLTKQYGYTITIHQNRNITVNLDNNETIKGIREIIVSGNKTELITGTH